MSISVPTLAVLEACELLEDLVELARGASCPICHARPGCSHDHDCPVDRAGLVARALAHDDDAEAQLAKRRASERRQLGVRPGPTAKLVARVEEKVKQEALARSLEVSKTRAAAGLSTGGRQ